MPIIELQKRARELGRIRIGQQVTGTTREGKDYTRPEKLEHFRFTCASKTLLERVAELYGGETVAWDGAGTKQWEVVTTSNRIPILVPPNPVTQWLETWTGGGCVHRCDGQINVLTDEPCSADDPNHLNAKPTTRLSVVLRDVEGVGVWRLESHGWNSAVELPQAAEFLAQAGGYVDGFLSLEERISKGENARTGKPETRKFMVPIIEINVTPAELLAGGGRVNAPSIEGPVLREIEAPRADYIALAEAAPDADGVRAVWKQAREAGHMTDDLNTQLIAMAKNFGLVDGDRGDGPVLDPDALWQQIITVAGEQGMSLWDVETDLAQVFDGVKSPSGATPAQLAEYLAQINTAKASA